ncbi:MAG: hypothetical protein ABEH35_06250 [Haloarculaceae archaeon]
MSNIRSDRTAEQVAGEIPMVEIETTDFAGWDDCLRVSNGTIECIATTAVGPRILSLGFVDGRNLLEVIEEDAGETGGDEWRFYGGHRLWHAPEDDERSYVPDNDPIEYEPRENGVSLVEPAPVETGIEKEIVVEMADDAPYMTVTGRLTNEGMWPVELAPWSITRMDAGGMGIIPLSREGDGLLPDRNVTLWPYVDMDDDRLSFDSEAIRIEQDTDGDLLKVGASGADEWVAGVLDGVAFHKSFEYQPDATYPDRGCAVEIFTDDSTLEVETLAPLTTLEPGESVDHVERWTLVDGIESTATEDLLETLGDVA